MTGARKVLYVFSKYFGYAVGGAEMSTRRELEDRYSLDHEVHLLRVTNVTGVAAQSLRMNLPAHWPEHPIRFRRIQTRFKYLEYALNRRDLMKTLRRTIPAGSTLLTYGLYAPAALLAHGGESILMVRDELSAGRDANPYHGIRRILRGAYALADLPGRILWRRDFKRALGRVSRIEANSQFIASLVAPLAPTGTRIEIHYPRLELEPLRRAFEASRAGRVPQGRLKILSIGADALKGGEVLRHLASRFPDDDFLLVDRMHAAPAVSGNLGLLPWLKSTEELGSLYGQVDIIVVASQVAEAFSRVAREARELGLPVIGSDVGGIPEALRDHPSAAPYELVSPFRSLRQWEAAFARIRERARANDR